MQTLIYLRPFLMNFRMKNQHQKKREKIRSYLLCLKCAETKWPMSEMHQQMKGDVNQSEMHQTEESNDRYTALNEVDANQHVSKSFTNVESKFYRRSERMKNTKENNYFYFSSFAPELKFSLFNPLAFIRKINNETCTFREKTRDYDFSDFVGTMKKETGIH